MPLTEQQIAFKAAFRRGVTLAGGPVAAARSTRVCASLLSNYGNPERPEFPPIDICFDIDAASGSSIILRAWADLTGFDLVKRDEVADQIRRDVTSLAGDIAKDSGTVVSDALDAVRSGKPSVNTIKAFDEVAADLQEKVVDIRGTFRKAISQAS